MFSFLRSAKTIPLCLKPNAVLSTTVCRSHWNKDYIPGPYPRTDEEKLRAAAKYGLHPSEYKPYPDDGTGLGDYPKLPDISAENKDPYYPYDNPELKRNFNEPLHAQFGLIREDRYNINPKLRYPLWVQFLQFFGAMGLMFAIMCFFEKFKMFHPVIPKQYPREETCHYTFEPAEE